MDQLVQHEVLSIANKAVALCAELEAQPGVDAISVGFVRSKLQAASEKLHLIPLLADDVVTTGATVREGARVLGGGEILVAALCRVG